MGCSCLLFSTLTPNFLYCAMGWTIVSLWQSCYTLNASFDCPFFGGSFSIVQGTWWGADPFFQVKIWQKSEIQNFIKEMIFNCQKWGNKNSKNHQIFIFDFQCGAGAYFALSQYLEIFCHKLYDFLREKSPKIEKNITKFDNN
jgi:hypothetical protein